MRWFWRLIPHQHDDWMRMEDVKRLLKAWDGQALGLASASAKYECRRCGR